MGGERSGAVALDGVAGRRPPQDLDEVAATLRENKKSVLNACVVSAL